MRRWILLTLAVLLLLAMGTVPGAAKKGGEGAEVVHATLPCGIGWDDDSNTLENLDDECLVHNVRNANGDHYLILHGQIPDDLMEEFVADGSPKRYDTMCLVNYGFLYPEMAGEPWMWTDSTRKFTKDGKMTEVCKPPYIDPPPPP
jgi:hypothetical protein